MENKIEMESNINKEVNKNDMPKINQRNLQEGKYVIVKYLEEFFPGKITKLSRDGVTIQAMEKSGFFWKWPDREDKLTYSVEDIMQIIKEPQKRNSRGSYSVPEMEKYLEVYFFNEKNTFSV